MDIATLFGLATGIALVVYSITAKGGSAEFFWNLPALLLVLGGTLAATFVNYPLKNILSVFKVLKNAFRNTKGGYQKIIDQFTDLSSKARKQNLMSLEGELDKIEDRFMRSGIELAINEKDQDRLRNYLNLELSNMEKRHTIGQELFFYMGMYAPAFGMVGTIVGLIVMMKNFTGGGIGADVGAAAGSFEFDIATKMKELLSGMGLALLTTFYGLILANLLFIPLGGKLKRRSDEEIMMKEFMIEGIMCLHNRDHPMIVREKLNTFVPSSERKAEDAKKGKQKKK
ncbi:MotA/TolQ/ExbB proton channel family protein [bacterium]|nr:MotA/TolQ/ExbB proton channel family protein [bacterium]MBU1064419.1 MotA/TolQ/ExbB proton channel family protein [bacterium]MBU1633646.1 MotA/TolQ/ExbB proton channel family protein [bacterium]MBU1873564.1 MotA/TolQ/ExbB proton channel family protein [bacterium]